MVEDQDIHIDEWLDRTYYIPPEQEILGYVHLFFTLARLPAAQRLMYETHLKDMKLFVDYEGKRYRVTGASRLGDIWLQRDLDRSSGYNLRVPFNLQQLTNWSKTP